MYVNVVSQSNKAKLKQKEGKVIKKQNLKKMQIQDKLDKRLVVRNSTEGGKDGRRERRKNRQMEG